jgi:hypothetical protein
VSRLIRRHRYTGQHRPDATRPLPSWPPAQDPWLGTAQTTLMPAVTW